MADRAGAERMLHHPVAVTLAREDGAVMIAASVGGEPPATRLAWIDWRAGAIAARVGCPPGLPSRLRPLVATDVQIAQGGVDDRVFAVRADPGIAAIRLVLAEEEQPEPISVGPEGIALAPVADRTVVVAIDALAANGEPVGRLDAAGIGHLVLSGGKLAGRLGASHGMAAGFGAGYWVDDADAASFESGFAPILPRWVPPDLPRGRFHVEPDVAYPSAPPSVAIAWGKEPRRVLVRQTPGVLASPDPGGARTEPVAIGDAIATRMVRGRFATLVWQTEERAFGVQIAGFTDPGAVAVRVAASV